MRRVRPTTVKKVEKIENVCDAIIEEVKCLGSKIYI